MTGQSPGDQIRQLAAWLAATDIGLLELRTPQGHIRLRRDAAGEVAHETVSEPRSVDATGLHPVVAPSVGVFLHRHPLHDTPLMLVGQPVEAGHTIGLLRVDTLLLPVEAARSGVVDSVPTAHGSTVGYGAVLINLRPL